MSFVTPLRRPDLPHLLLPILVLSACGGGGGGGPTTDPVVDRVAIEVVQDQGTDPGSYLFNPTARAVGAYLLPRQQVALAVVDDDPMSRLAVERRIQVVFVDVDRGADTYGEVVDSAIPAYLAPPTKPLHGIAATSFRDTDGSVDALFVTTGGEPNQVLATTVDGVASTGGVLGTTVISGISAAQLDPAVIPAVESGTFGGETRIFMAYVADTPTHEFVRFGFLDRTGPASWHFSGRGGIPSLDPTDRACSPSYQIAAAFDANRGEFTIAWECGSFTALARRVNWDGVTVGPTFDAHRGPEALHSGVTLSYNRVADRYLFTFQHNTALLTPNAAGSFDCPPDPAVGCATTVPGCLALDGHWASEADYGSGFEFRVGASALLSGGGRSYRLATGQTGTRCSDVHLAPHDWELEAEIWPARPASMVHDYVRCPESGITVAVHFRTVTGSGLGELRYSFLDEPSVRPFDE